MSSSKMAAFLICTATILIAGCGKPSGSNKSVFSGGSATGGKLWVSGMNAVMESSKPTILFVQHGVAGGPRQIGCFFVVREPPSAPGRSSHKWEGNISMNGESGRVTGKLNADASKIAIDYSIALDEDKTAIKDSVTIGGADYSFNKGRVFEIDLAATPIKVVQLDLALPQETPATSENTDLGAIANRTLEELKQRSSELADFGKTPQKK